jgi:hypothetical protein
MKLFIAALALATPLVAHHSFLSQYDESKWVLLEGKVTRVDWANPHVYFYLDVKDSGGAVVHWVCETGGPGALIRAGWKRDALKPGHHVTVKAYLAKDGSKSVDARIVTLPGGRKVFTGLPPDDGPRATD